MHIDDFAGNLSFFFSYGMDPEYTVIGRVARRIWAVAMKNRYGANERSQKLKYHSQTSGRSLHAQEIAFNDIRTTAAGADLDLRQHQQPAHQRLRRSHHHAHRGIGAPRHGDPAHHHREWGLAKNENPNQGAFIIDELTDLVEEAVLKEFEAISERGGVLGAMETGYQRGKIQEESMYYEHKKHDGSYPIIASHFPQPARGRRAAENRTDPLDRRGKAKPAKAPARLQGAPQGRVRPMLARLQQAVIDIRTCSKCWWTRCAAARSGRSRMRCSRWGGSTGEYVGPSSAHTARTRIDVMPTFRNLCNSRIANVK